MSESRFPRWIEQALILRKLQSYEEIDVRVVREISQAERTCGYEAALRNPDAEFWREPCTRALKNARKPTAISVEFTAVARDAASGINGSV